MQVQLVILYQGTYRCVYLYILQNWLGFVSVSQCVGTFLRKLSGDIGEGARRQLACSVLWEVHLLQLVNIRTPRVMTSTWKQH